MQELLNAILEGKELPPVKPLEILGALLLSFILNLCVAQLYRNTYKGTRYSQDFVQTLIMIGTITTILIIVVRGNAGVAFGMFAAFSMIRFRRNLSQARDLGFLFFSMAIGMMVGARMYSECILVTLAASAFFYFLMKSSAFAPKKASHNIVIRMTSDLNFEERLHPIWQEMAEKVELNSVRSAQAGMMTELRYGLQLKNGITIYDLMEKLQLACGNNRVVITPTGNEFDSI